MCVRTDKALGTVGVVAILAPLFSDLSQVLSQRGSPSSPALGCSVGRGYRGPLGSRTSGRQGRWGPGADPAEAEP